MGKNVVVFSDGTGQDGGARPEQRISNIYKMYRISRDHADTAIDPSKQVVFYDAGLGTDIGATALTAPVRFVQKLLGSVTGAGIKRNIADCYEFIINHYEEGDRIFLFGFSRGAYTVRSLANLLMLCGVPTETPGGPLMRHRKAAKDIAWEAVDTVLEHGAGHPRAEFEYERLELARRFQLKYRSGDGTDSNVAPYFIGVFDTVAALGASGMRYLVIQAGLAAGVSAVAFAAGFLPSMLFAVLYSALFGTNFMLVGFVAQVAIVGAALGAFWYWQTKADTKTISDYPKPGEFRSHKAVWKGENFDRLLSKHVAFARSANAIDETRKDFDRVAWGGGDEGSPHFPGHERLRQWWFAGNHSDVGGSYPEPESRLSDVALEWMCHEAVSVPNGLLTGPIFVGGVKMPNTGDFGPALNVYPAADGVQHCEVAGMRDTIDGYAAKLPKWSWLQKYVARQNWETKIRNIDPAAKVHPTVGARFDLPSVLQCTRVGAYRPDALANHNAFKQYYHQVGTAANSTPPS
ncbi:MULTISPECIES: DUF2235 domain-containing protein [unclassified Bradyrhizobium]|uniref:phospholipase effector Tle1 domain-containing protein n=1 Tax=unclassified Bradyrhizobium TaxID=2631580 RepID=UPI001CD3555D|nr:DUF2235 domain-containing protein [Bradyrhizobium sp. IC3123]MCA1430596.1 DUF2235 domain-containing protein [Bradyrhizobium sp. NBAIM16]MCA1480107.1 DUF2235 domain-containing protein [Bradyrhizobium sp. NBAIM08]MCA1508663.1 DUF2235 domain-containing protein [Bradyrhizobium sp. NBAIM02]